MPGERSAGRSLRLRIRRNGGLYLLMIPAMIIFICFTYLPMYGIVIAFKNFKPARGILGSEWAGLRYFKKYFSSYMFSNTIRNTLVISIYTILVTFPLPILIALMCNQMYAKRFKKFFQVSTYLPHFISTVVMCGMIVLFLSPSSGVIPKLLGYIGVQTGDLMGKASAFSSIYVWTEAWQHVGWDSIMYIAALSAVDPQLYEAAVVDGANKWQKMRSIDIPLLMPTAVVLFILRAGSVCRKRQMDGRDGGRCALLAGRLRASQGVRTGRRRATRRGEACLHRAFRLARHAARYFVSGEARCGRRLGKR